MFIGAQLAGTFGAELPELDISLAFGNLFGLHSRVMQLHFYVAQS